MNSLYRYNKIYILAISVSILLFAIVLYQNKQYQNKNKTSVLRNEQTPVICPSQNSELLSNNENLTRIDCKLSTVSSAELTGNTSKRRENISDGIIQMDVSLDDLPLPSASLLSQENQERAISFFESQRRSWLAIKTISAKYTTKMQHIKKGKLLNEPMYIQSGTLEFAVELLLNPTGHQSPARVQIRLFDKKSKSGFVKDNALDWKEPWQQWTENTIFPMDISRTKKERGLYETDLLFLPLDFMAKTYGDKQYHRASMMTREQFFSRPGVPIRLSTQEETKRKFKGELQYLFMASPALIDAHYWFSAENGELRQIDALDSNQNVVKSFRYEDYVYKEDEGAKWPCRFISTWKKGTGDETAGWQYTIELTDVEINNPISPQRFIPPDGF